MATYRAEFRANTKSEQNSWWAISIERSKGRFQTLKGLMRFSGTGEAGESFTFDAERIEDQDMVLPDGTVMVELVAI